MVSVILPVYRNERTLAELCSRLAAALAGRGGVGGVGEFEIVMVIDASPDRSAEVASQIAAARAEVRVVELARNIGQSRTIVTGLSYARGDIAVVMDADLQDPPEAVPEIVRKLEESPEMEALFATRMNRYSSRGRHLTSRLFKLVMRMLSRGRIPANAGLFLALRRELYVKLASHREQDIHLVGLVARMARSTGAMAVPRAPTEGGSYTSAMRLAVAWKSVRTLLGLPRRKGITPVEVRSTINLAQQTVRS